MRDVGGEHSGIQRFDTSCFDGCYITGDVTAEYLAEIEANRCDGETRSDREAVQQLDLNLNLNTVSQA